MVEGYGSSLVGLRITPCFFECRQVSFVTLCSVCNPKPYTLNPLGGHLKASERRGSEFRASGGSGLGFWVLGLGFRASGAVSEVCDSC